jgi:chemotaxis methyl-accepting protein methylase
MKSHLTVEPSILEQIVRRLSDAAGIDPASLEVGRITWTIERRCRHLKLPDPLAYLEQLGSSTTELEELIDALVIQETRFFRDPAVFDHLCLWAQSMMASSTGSLRILSAPCSTGQEAYSLAAILHCAGIPFSAFAIDAFDISHTALATAQRGVYPASALQNTSADLQVACGTLRNQHWHMREELRNLIRFERRNLADSSALDDAPGYHLILCRNLFIYLHAPARAILAESLRKALLPGGQLIVGSGDRVAELNERFTPLKPMASFGFTHKLAASLSNARSDVPTPRATARASYNSRPTPNLENHAIATTAVEFYRRALEHNEHGNARKAERRCRQALYLEPGYLPALELLQALWASHPNLRLKRALKARIQRVRKENGSLLMTQHQADGDAL